MATAPIAARDVRRAAGEAVRWCRTLASCSEEPDGTTRTFLSAPMRDVHAQLTACMERLGLDVRVDPAGNLRGLRAASPDARPRRLYVGSHLDTVPRAGAFDGVLGVVLGIALVELLGDRVLPFSIEVVGFSDEEGVRFGVPFIGSRALAGTVDEALLERRDAHGTRVSEAILEYGLDPTHIGDAKAGSDAIGYFEFHIEQGPVLEHLGLPLGIVDAIVGQTRLDVVLTGSANHAGTTPMDARRDALAGAAEWIGEVEREARGIPGLVATVGQIDVQPGATNVIAGWCRASLDIRHGHDRVRTASRDRLIGHATEIAARRGLEVTIVPRLDQAAVGMDKSLVRLLARAVESSGVPLHHMPSGAGHDAMIVAGCMPVAMLFVRSPGGISHHPDESVVEDDVAAALAVGLRFLEELAAS